ncbi:hypothetical protein THF5G08_230035 [Vibrio jasicida]|uniref:RHS repeat-associated core domain-containing protein n=1 Tax=Vibrio jasicida TaxID=766224 RepID=UPI002893881C|nr:hypothetical protein THF5G08_230035 [Vibrio jasicida]
MELRCSKNGDVISEVLETLTLSASGRHQARLLNWTEGKPTDIDNHQVGFSLNDQLGSSAIELDYNANILTKEEYYPFGGTSVRASKSETEVKYKTMRYSGKERDSSGLYYYGFRYYQPWAGRWLSSDPAGTVDGLNLYRMVRNNPITLKYDDGLAPTEGMDSEIGKYSIEINSKVRFRYSAAIFYMNPKVLKYKHEGENSLWNACGSASRRRFLRR